MKFLSATFQYRPFFLNTAPSIIVHNGDVFYSVETKKSVHISESRSVRKRGGQNQQNSLGESPGCSH